MVPWIVSVALLVVAPQHGEHEGRTEALISVEKVADPIGMNYNHPSDLAECQDGSLVCAWRGGPNEGSANVLYYSRRPAGGDWSRPQPLEPNPEGTQCECPVLYQPRKAGAPLICWFVIGPKLTGKYSALLGGKGFMRISNDHGKTWSARIPCPKASEPWFAPWDGCYLGPLMNPPLELPDGSLIAACSIDGVPGRHDPKEYKSALVRIPADNYTGREPKGTPWSALAAFEAGSGIQGALLSSPDARTLAYVSRTSGPHLVSRSTDGGKTWSEFQGLKGGGNVGVGALSLDLGGGPTQGWHVICGSGPTGNGQQRNGLELWVSQDMNRWTKALTLCKNDDREDGDPSIIQGKDRKIHLVFTGRKGSYVSHAVLDPDKLVSGK
jgi:hypothetical protein